MAMHATVFRFSGMQEALDACGVQLGISVTPFASADKRAHPPATGDRIPHREHCWAYFNAYSDLEHRGRVCGTLSGFDNDTLRLLQHTE